MADFRKKIPVVGAWLAHAAGNEGKALAALERELGVAGVASETDVTEAVRKSCLTALGLASSRREPYRLPVTLMVNCPVVSKERRGCSLFYIGLIKRLFGR